MPAADYSANADLLRVPVGGASLHVERYGLGGRPVVLLHGLGTSSFLWRQVGPELALGGARAFAVDLVGHGESDRLLEASYGIAAQAEYLDRAMTALRIASATFVGVDLGGAVALRLAATRPDRVARLVLVNSLTPEACPGRDVDAIQSFRTMARFVIRISRGLLRATPLLRTLLEPSVADPSRLSSRLLARYLAPYVGRDGAGHLLTLARTIDDDDLADLQLETLETPTLVVHGDRDPWVDESAAEALARTLPNARLVRLPGLSRLVPEDEPATMVSLILEHMGLRGTEDGPPAEAGAVALATGGTGSVEPSADVVATAEPDDERAV
jgi:pimeloyl-ACP methyl ester carboxylesterase